MQPVFQNPDLPECGAACLAMIARVSLEKARLTVYAGAEPKRLGRKKMLAGLAEFGILPKGEKCTRLSNKFKLSHLKWDALLQGATLYKDKKKWKKSLHWLVWDHECQCVRDPLGFSDPVLITSATELLC